MDYEMIACERQTRTPHTRSRAGFSLVELMVVVVITGVLAAIAIPTFSGYIFKSRTSEAVHFLGVIKLKQESFRAEFGRYADGRDAKTKPGEIVFTPAVSSMKGATVDFPAPGHADAAAFVNLGARPNQGVRFAYGWAAGTPTQAADANLDDAPYDVEEPLDHYFIAQAVSDLDGNGTQCTFEVTSFTTGTWFSPSRGWE